ncbi:MAG: HlyC/CorC family transporter [Chloroflexi bacterium]|nr:HlyC/CorC family transporter [Chloroflexota bacterium]
MPETLFEITIILLLLVINGLFAMSEIAIVSARPIRLQQMAQRGSRGAVVALELVNSPNRFLSTVQVGITLVGIFAGAFGGANIAGELAVPLRELRWVGRYADALSLVIVVGTITFLSVVIGELVPKRIALGNAEQIAALVSRPMRALSIIATPVVRLFSIATDMTLKLLGVQSPKDEEVNEEEIRMMLQQGAAAGTIEEAERDMVESIFRLGDRTLESIMTPRPEIVWIDVNAPQEEVRHLIYESNSTRFPVCDGALDRVLGVVQSKDLLFACLEGETFDIRTVMQEPLLIPDKMQALKALERFRQSGLQIALVFDEYGGIEGLVTLIDILEAIVGDIPTLNEKVDPPIVQREDGSWLVDGIIPIDDFKEAFAIGLLPGEDKYQTLGGFVVFMLGSIPTTGNHFIWGGFRFEVADMDGYRVDKVLFKEKPLEDETDSSRRLP